MGKQGNYYMGKMVVVYMGNVDGTKNQSCRTWHEEKGLYGIPDPRRGGNARQHGRVDGDKSERANRESRQEASFNDKRGSQFDGGIVSQLISEYRDQVAVKKTTIRNLELEIQDLESRVHQLETVQEQLEKTLKDT
jgi:hypothetical protein